MRNIKRCYNCTNCVVRFPLSPHQVLPVNSTYNLSWEKISYKEAMVSCKKGHWLDSFGNPRSMRYFVNSQTPDKGPRGETALNRTAEGCDEYSPNTEERSIRELYEKVEFLTLKAGGVA